MNPMISVVMSVYNAEKYLQEAIQSILTQTYKDFEFIIINDGSSDKSLEIIEKYRNQDERIVLISRENRGLIASLNEGIEKARGKYIARMDADDISLPERFEKQLELMEKDTLDICGCHYFLINEKNDFVSVFLAPIIKSSFYYHMANTVPFGHPSVMYRKDFFERHNLFYGKSRYQNAEDYALWLNMWQLGASFGNVNAFLFKYRDFSESLSKKNNKKISNDRDAIRKEFLILEKTNIVKDLEESYFLNKSKEEKELIVLTIFRLFKLSPSFKILKFLKKCDKRAIVCGFFKYIINT